MMALVLEPSGQVALGCLSWAGPAAVELGRASVSTGCGLRALGAGNDPVPRGCHEHRRGAPRELGVGALRVCWRWWEEGAGSAGRPAARSISLALEEGRDRRAQASFLLMRFTSAKNVLPANLLRRALPGDS